MSLAIALFRVGLPKFGLTEALWRADWRMPAIGLNGLPWPGVFDPALGSLVITSLRFERGGLLGTPVATLSFAGDGEATFALSRWRDLAAGAFEDVTLGALTIRNVVDVFVSAAEGVKPFALTLDGVSRGFISGREWADNTIFVGADSLSGGTVSNTFVIRTGAGNDTVTIGTGQFTWSGTPRPGPAYQERFTVVNATLGDGDNRFTSGGSRDTVTAGSGDDIVSTGGGNDTARLGGGENRFDGGPGCDTYIVRGAFAGYTIETDDQGRFVLTDIDLADGDDGRTTLIDVEKIVFEGEPGGPRTVRLAPCDNDGVANRRPVARPDSIVINEDTPMALAAKGILANDVDPDPGDRLRAVIVSPLPMKNIDLFLPNGRPVAFGAPFEAFDGIFRIVPKMNWWGDDGFIYVAIDRPLNNTAMRASAPQVVQIVVRPVNDDPEIIPGVKRVTDATFSGVPIVFENDFLRALFFDVDRQRGDGPLDRESNVFDIFGDDVKQPMHGIVAVLPDGDVVYRPNDGFVGVDTFFVRVTDLKDGRSDWLPVVVTVAGPPPGDVPPRVDKPRVVFVPPPEDKPGGPRAEGDGTYMMAEDTTTTIRADALLANDRSEAGGKRVLNAFSADGNAVVTFDADAKRLTITPKKDYHGPLLVHYVMTDDSGLTSTAGVRIEVEPVNDAPVANDDGPVNVFAGGSVTTTLAALKANDTDIDNETSELRILSFNAPDGVTVNWVGNDNGGADTTVTFIAAPGLAGKTVTVVYTLSDPDGLNDTAKITLVVRDGLIARDDIVTTSEFKPFAGSNPRTDGAGNLNVVLTNADLLANDTPAIPGDPLQVQGIVPNTTLPGLGTFPTVVFTPLTTTLGVPNDRSISEATVTVVEPAANLTATSTLRIIVNGAPEGQRLVLNTDGTGLARITREQLLAGVTDPEGDAFDLATPLAPTPASSNTYEAVVAGRDLVEASVRDGVPLIPGLGPGSDLDALFAGALWLGWLQAPEEEAFTFAEFGVEVADARGALDSFILELRRYRDGEAPVVPIEPPGGPIGGPPGSPPRGPDDKGTAVTGTDLLIGENVLNFTPFNTDFLGGVFVA